MKMSGEITSSHAEVSSTVRGDGKQWRKLYSSLEQAANEAESLGLISAARKRLIVTGARGPDYPDGTEVLGEIEPDELLACGFLEV